MTMDSERAAIEATGDLIVRYAGAIILAPPPSVAGEFHSASGLFVEWNDQYFFLTAHHVVGRDYEVIRARDPAVLAHLGALQFEPSQRLVCYDSGADTAVLRVSQEEVKAVDRWVYHVDHWPPAPPRIGQLVGIAGYPAQIRVGHQKSAYFSAAL